MGLAAQTPDHYKMSHLISDIDTLYIHIITFTFHSCSLLMWYWCRYFQFACCLCMYLYTICLCYPFVNFQNIVVTLFCFVVSALFGVTGRVEARLSGFFPQRAEVFPWHIVWAHKCLNLVLCYMSFSWSLALSLAIAVIVVHKCLIFV